MTSPPPFPTDEELAKAGWVKISRRDRRILSRPRVGQVYWVDFAHDAYEPEFVGEHPCVVVRAAGSLNDTCVVVPLTTRPQENVPHTHMMEQNPIPKGKAGDSYAVCTHLYTVNICRLRPLLSPKGVAFYPYVSAADRAAIFGHIRVAFAHILGENGAAIGVESAPKAENAKPAYVAGPRTLSLPGSRK